MLGPTASGKSALAESLAARYGGELINSDASALYRELQVGVTKPSGSVREALRYHLLDVAGLDCTVTVVEYQRLALEVLRDLQQRQALAVLVGGTNLYVRALLEGYRPPAIEVPEAIRQTARSMPLDEAVKLLAALDPDFLSRIDSRNPRRVSRALELVLAKGGAVEEPTAQPLDGWATLRLLLWPQREALQVRIRRRTEEMWESWLEECLDLEKKGLARWLEVRKPIGYSSVMAHLHGRMSRSEAIDAVVRATCVLAKKQRTWLQKDTEGPDRHVFVLAAESDWESLPERASAVVEGFLARFTE